jgi:hypothetical protein
MFINVILLMNWICRCQWKKTLPHFKVFGGNSKRNLGSEYVSNQIYDTVLPGTDEIV